MGGRELRGQADFAEDYKAPMVCLGLTPAAADIGLPLHRLLIPQISAEARVCVLCPVMPVETAYGLLKAGQLNTHCFCTQTAPLKCGWTALFGSLSLCLGVGWCLSVSSHGVGVWLHLDQSPVNLAGFHLTAFGHFSYGFRP